MDRFFTELQDRCVMLTDPEEAVRFSFIAKPSISYLNLQLLEYSKLKDHSRTVSEVANDFVSTEEKCRMIFAPSRSLFYKLNLDMPERRENRLQNDIPIFLFRFNLDIPHIAKITLSSELYFSIVTNFIEDALKVTDKRLRILEILVKSPRMKREILRILPARVIHNFMDYFYPFITDSVIFKGFVETFYLEEWMTEYEEPAILEHLLYYVRKYKRNLKEEGYVMCQLIDECILVRMFSNIKPILKYTDAPEFSFDAYEMYVLEILNLIPNLTYEVLIEIETRVTPQRLYWMLQILFMCIEGERRGFTEPASKTLNLLWNSSPAAYIAFAEIEMAFRGALSDLEIANMYEFYCNSIGEDHSVVEPRMLQHLCRTTIRRILKNNFWIPEGVRLTGLPEALQTYLNLE